MKGLLTFFQGLRNERNRYPKLVIVAVEKTADMRSADHCVAEANPAVCLARIVYRKVAFVTVASIYTVLFYYSLGCLSTPACYRSRPPDRPTLCAPCDFASSYWTALHCSI